MRCMWQAHPHPWHPKQGVNVSSRCHVNAVAAVVARRRRQAAGHHRDTASSCRLQCSSRSHASSSSSRDVEFKALFLQLHKLSTRQLRQAVGGNPDLISAPFLFWLQDLERSAKKTGSIMWRMPAPSSTGCSPSHTGSAPLNGTGFILLSSSSPDDGSSTGLAPVADTQHSTDTQPPSDLVLTSSDISALASELVALREHQEQDMARRLLPALASSVAYDNLARWQRDAGVASGSIPVPGIPQVPLEHLYRISEKQEQDMRQGTSSWAGGGGAGGKGLSQGPRREQGFASRPENGAFAGMAASMMARVRSRFMGYEDGEGAAGHVLDTLLWCAVDLGERAEMLHTACTPPGLPYHPPPSTSPQHTQHSSSQAGSAGGAGQTRQQPPGRSSQLSSRAGSDMLGGAGRPGAAAWQADGSHLGAYSRQQRLAGFSGPGASQGPASPPTPAPGAQDEQQPSLDPATGSAQPATGTLLVTTPQAVLDEIHRRLAAAPSSHQPALPCGTDMQQALSELSEIVQEYEANVWSRRSALDVL